MGIPNSKTDILGQYTNIMSLGTPMMDKHSAHQINTTLMPKQDTGIPEGNTAILGQFKHTMDTPMGMMNTHTDFHI